MSHFMSHFLHQKSGARDCSWANLALWKDCKGWPHWSLALQDPPFHILNCCFGIRFGTFFQKKKSSNKSQWRVVVDIHIVVTLNDHDQRLRLDSVAPETSSDFLAPWAPMIPHAIADKTLQPNQQMPDPKCLQVNGLFKLFLRERSQHQPPIRLMHSDIGSGLLISCNALWKVLKNSITLLTPFSARKATEYSMPSISSWVSMVASDQLLLLIVTWDCRAMGWQTNRRERCRQTVTFSFGEECKNEEENAISSIDSRYWCIIILFQCRHDIYQAIKNTYYACLPHRVANSQTCDTISAWYLGDHWEDYQHTLKSSWLVNLRRSTIKPLKIKQVHGHDIWV